MKKKSFMLTELPANAAVLNDRCGAFKRTGSDVYGAIRPVLPKTKIPRFSLKVRGGAGGKYTGADVRLFP